MSDTHSDNPSESSSAPEQATRASRQAVWTAQFEYQRRLGEAWAAYLQAQQAAWLERLQAMQRAHDSYQASVPSNAAQFFMPMPGMDEGTPDIRGVPFDNPVWGYRWI